MGTLENYLKRLEKEIPMPLDSGDNRKLPIRTFIGGDFGDPDNMPGVVACAMSFNPSLEESCYRPDMQDILDRIDPPDPREPKCSFYWEKDHKEFSAPEKRSFDLEEIELALDGVVNYEQKEEIKRRLRTKN